MQKDYSNEEILLTAIYQEDSEASLRESGYSYQDIGQVEKTVYSNK